MCSVNNRLLLTCESTGSCQVQLLGEIIIKHRIQIYIIFMWLLTCRKIMWKSSFRLNVPNVITDGRQRTLSVYWLSVSHTQVFDWQWHTARIGFSSAYFNSGFTEGVHLMYDLPKNASRWITFENVSWLWADSHILTFFFCDGGFHPQGIRTSDRLLCASPGKRVEEWTADFIYRNTKPFSPPSHQWVCVFPGPPGGDWQPHRDVPLPGWEWTEDSRLAGRLSRCHSAPETAGQHESALDWSAKQDAQYEVCKETWLIATEKYVKLIRP